MNRDCGLPRVLIALASTGFLSTMDFAAAATCDNLTRYSKYLRLTPPDTATDLAVVVDANTGEILSEPHHFDGRKRVPLVFVHKNPVRFQYRFQITGKEAESGILVDGLKGIGISFGQEASEAEKAAQTQTQQAVVEEVQKRSAAATSRSAAAAAPDPCDYPALQDLVETAGRVDRWRKKALEEFAGGLKEIDGEIVSLQGEQKVLLETTPRSENESLGMCSKLDAVRTRAGKVALRPGFKNLTQQLQDQKQTLSDLLARLRVEAPNHPCDALEALAIRSTTSLISELTADLNNVASASEKLAAAQKEAKAFLESTQHIQDTTDSYVEVRGLGPTRTARIYDVKIHRADRLGEKLERVISVSEPIRLARPRLSVSSGIALTFGTQRTFERQSSPQTIDGTTSVVDIVGVGNESRSRIGVVGQVNGLGWFFEHVSVGWSLGASVTDGDDASQFGFYTGPTFGFIDDQLLITAAYHVRKVERLGGNLSVGDVLPEEFTGEIPTTERSEGGLLISVTYRIK